MTGWQSVLVFAVAVAFAIFLIVQMLPGTLALVRAPRDPGLAPLLDRVRQTSGRDKAIALLELGEHAARARRVPAASGYFLRAMRADPAWLEPIDRLAALLRTRPRTMHRILWRQLAAIPWEGSTRPVAARIAEILGESRATVKPPVAAHREVMKRLSAVLR